MKNGDKTPYIIEGVRTPFVKAGNEFSNLFAQDLGRLCVTELLYRADCNPQIIDEVIFGNVAQPSEVSNISRVISLNSGLANTIPAYSVQRNCASGIQAIINGADAIKFGKSEAVICGSTDSVSNIPLKTNRHMSEFYAKFSLENSLLEKAKAFRHFRIDFFHPVVAIARYLKDGYSGLTMGETAELIAKQFRISRNEQDEWALRSHQRASAAQNNNLYRQETLSVFIEPDYKKIIDRDLSVRLHQSMKALQKLRPFYDRGFGTVTRGNMAPLVDGATALLIMSKEKAAETNYEPEFKILATSEAAVAPKHMGIAPVYAISSVLKKAKLSLNEIELFEINEIYAAHVLAVIHAINNGNKSEFDYPDLLMKGEIPLEKVNVNGGAIAIGHSLSASSSRIVIHLMKEMKRRNLSLGLATASANGGQALSVILERS